MKALTAKSLVLTALFAAVVAPGAALAETAANGPADVARQFLQAFEKKDWATVRTLFAPNAVVSTVNLDRQGAPEVAYLTVDEWLKRTEKEMTPVTFTKLEMLDTSALSFDQGATVSVRFRSSGKVGSKGFTNNGIDTYSMTPAGGTWRILRYGTFELIDVN